MCRLPDEEQLGSEQTVPLYSSAAVFDMTIRDLFLLNTTFLHSLTPQQILSTLQRPGGDVFNDDMRVLSTKEPA